MWPLFELLRFLSAFLVIIDPIISVATNILFSPNAYIPNTANSPVACMKRASRSHFRNKAPSELEES